jgi:DNA-binding CsgD family transcriptional regulator
MVGHVGLGLAYLQGDRFERSEEAFANALGTFERFGGPNAYVTHHLWGLERYTAGSWDEAVAEFETGLAMAEDIQAVYLSGLARAVMASIAAHRNDLLGAERILAPLDDAPQRLGGPDIYFSLWGRGLLAACRGDDAQAGLLLGNSWAIVAGVDAIAHLNWFAPEHVRLQLRVGNVTEAGAAALVLEGAAARVPDVPSIRGMALRCRGLVEGDVDLLLAAVASYRDSPRPIERAWACEDAGAALVRAGRHQEGIDLLEEAREGLQSVDALRDIRRIDAALRAAGVRRGSRAERRRVRHGPGSLTETERKVIGLIEDGRTNRQIAEQLFISPRTVDTHVAHILAKLGVRSRREAVGLMRTAG